MNTEKLLETIDYIRATYPEITMEQITALEMARRELEKEIPRKKRRNKTQFFCTNCNSRVRLVDQYCPQCGWKFTMEE